MIRAFGIASILVAVSALFDTSYACINGQRKCEYHAIYECVNGYWVIQMGSCHSDDLRENKSASLAIGTLRKDVKLSISPSK